jgi:hypothetical protein
VGTHQCHTTISVAILISETTDSHYDVISAPLEGWNSDPFSLSGRNGYLYGRGVTDNKGPIMAVACAAAELLGLRQLELDLVFLIEGEEETGSSGFAEAVRRHKVKIIRPRQSSALWLIRRNLRTLSDTSTQFLLGLSMPDLVRANAS